MRKSYIAGLVTVVAVLGIATGALGAAGVRKMIEVEYRNISIKVDGRTVKTDAEPFLVVSAGRTYVPARALAEALNAKVGWDAETNSVLVFTPDYVEGQTAGDTTTWSMPYYNLKFQVPATMGRSQITGFPLALQAGSDMFFGLRRMGDPENIGKLPVSFTSETINKALATQWGEGKLVRQQKDSIAGREATTSLTEYTVQGQGLQLWVTSVSTQTDVWAFFAVTPKGMGGDVLAQIYSTITLP